MIMWTLSEPNMCTGPGGWLGDNNRRWTDHCGELSGYEECIGGANWLAGRGLMLVDTDHRVSDRVSLQLSTEAIEHRFEHGYRDTANLLFGISLDKRYESLD